MRNFFFLSQRADPGASPHTRNCTLRGCVAPGAGALPLDDAAARLYGGVQICDFIEEKCSAVGRFDIALAVVGDAGEGALRAPKISCSAILRDGGAVYGDEGLSRCGPAR